jgi:LPXTG-site transpeptidase (sortase) family protein
MNEPDTKSPRLTKKRKLILYAIVIFVLADIGYLVNQIVDQSKRQGEIAKLNSSLGGQNVPSSVKPTTLDINSYKVAANMPRYLIIPKLNIKAKITVLNLDKDNRIQAPYNIYNAGWFTGSSLPGKPGAVFIDGHVASWTANGLFFNLKSLQKGDDINIIMGSDKVYSYSVYTTKTYDVANVDMAQALSPIGKNKQGLNIMTCTGNVENGQYTKRLVVYAIPKS